VCLLLQSVYIAKFFWWNYQTGGYYKSIDIILDHAGWYLVWGCCCFLPTLYTNSTLYLVDHPIELGAPLALANLAVGLACIYVNYIIDEQRQEVRASNGECKLGFGPDWGADPRVLVARYTTTNGDCKTSALLVNGWWGASRHFHYVPELGAALAWSCQGGVRHLTPYLYFMFLCVLLTDRAVRDEVRLSLKYGKDFAAYCRLVPWRIIPGVW